MLEYFCLSYAHDCFILMICRRERAFPGLNPLLWEQRAAAGLGHWVLPSPDRSVRL